MDGVENESHCHFTFIILYSLHFHHCFLNDSRLIMRSIKDGVENESNCHLHLHYSVLNFTSITVFTTSWLINITY